MAETAADAFVIAADDFSRRTLRPSPHDALGRGGRRSKVFFGKKKTPLAAGLKSHKETSQKTGTSLSIAQGDGRIVTGCTQGVDPVDGLRPLRSRDFGL
jgi:hypothetical protein